MQRRWLWALGLIVMSGAFSVVLALALGWRPMRPSDAAGRSNDSVRQTISVAQGGRVALPIGAALIVPPRSLSADGTVTLTSVHDNAPSLVKYDIGRPAGPAVRAEVSASSIAGPVTLELPYDPRSLSEETPEYTVFAAYYDENKGQWTPVGGKVDQQRKVVVVTTDHLSLWRPFTWNWDAWIAVLNKVMSLEVTQWLEAEQLLTEDCSLKTTYVSVDWSEAREVIKGCIDNGNDPQLLLRVVNLKSFDIGLSAPGAKEIVAAPGTSVSFTANASGIPPYNVKASFSDEAMQRFVLRLVFKMLPNLGELPGQAMQEVAQDMGAPIGLVGSVTLKLQQGDRVGAAEQLIRVVTDEVFIRALVQAMVRYGEKHGVDLMGKITVENAKKVIIAVSATSVIFSTTDFIANYFFNYQSIVRFYFTAPPQPNPTVPTPTATLPLTSGGTSVGRIAFVSLRDGNGEIYIINPDGGNLTRLTNNPAYDGQPFWSPDGSKIAFMSDRDGNSEIYVMNADGSNQTRLTSNPAYDGEPTWSPDSRKIAFRSDRDGNGEIYVMNADGSNPIRLTNNTALDWFPNWSPDGSKIAFGSDRDGNEEIYVMNADGSNQTRLTNNPTSDGGSAWSPDGRKIAFRSDRDGNTESYVMNADGSNPIRLTNNPAYDGTPNWSPDGRKMALRSNRDGNMEIYVINADGSNPVRLTQNPADDLGPVWSRR